MTGKFEVNNELRVFERDLNQQSVAQKVNVNEKDNECLLDQANIDINEQPDDVEIIQVVDSFDKLEMRIHCHNQETIQMPDTDQKEDQFINFDLELMKDWVQKKKETAEKDQEESDVIRPQNKDLMDQNFQNIRCQDNLNKLLFEKDDFLKL